MSRPLLVAGGRLLDPEGDDLHRPPLADLLIKEGRIVATGEEATRRGGDAERLDARGLLVAPGFVNAHSHSHDTLLRGCFEGLPLDTWGAFAFPSAWARRPDTEVHLRTRLHAAECLIHGITTVQDMVTLQGADRAQAEAVIDAHRTIGLRALLGWQLGDRAMVDTLPFARESLPPEILATLPGDADPAPGMRLAEELLDRVEGPLLRSVLAPSAPQRCSPALLEWAAALSRERGLPVCTHVYETRAQAVLARQAYPADGGSFIRYLERHGLLNERLVIAHGVWIGSEEIARLGGAGGHLAHNPGANLKLLNGAAPVRRYARSGVGIALGCDNSSAGDAQNLFSSMRHAALYWSMQAGGPEEAAIAAFRAATLGGAKALGLAGLVGGLRPGHRADLALFDLSDPAWVPLNSAVRQLVHAEPARSLRHVLVDGGIALRDGRPTGFDPAALAAEAEARQGAIADELATLRQRRAPLMGALIGLEARSRAHPLPFDRYALDDGGLH
ncbi:amidohydrolase family protein [Roseomonas populi]|uniref:Amidohydrolase family protein n=1 Tax=Roseomonas populi TaxID=3121582 RepID=A0ABT1XBT2_9PROT|nr:amidohydrolase family protein [Roseomonas pecuniae]MCR0985585.1 amidohydrolase family protein [Roseomonas pecuniae]